LASEVYGKEEVPANYAVALAESMWNSGARAAAREVLAEQLNRLAARQQIGAVANADAALIYAAVAQFAGPETKATLPAPPRRAGPRPWPRPRLMAKAA
jgi:hypothetical protein